MAEAKIGLVLDCTDPEVLADFWAAALGMRKVGGVGSYVMLVSPNETLPQLLLQQVAEAKSGKNRMHLDIETPAVEQEVERLEGLGARRREATARFEHGSTWVVMADPEGNEFCVCDAGQG